MIKVVYSYSCDICGIWHQLTEITSPVADALLQEPDFPQLYGMTVCENCQPKVIKAFDKIMLDIRS